MDKQKSEQPLQDAQAAEPKSETQATADKKDAQNTTADSELKAAVSVRAEQADETDPSGANAKDETYYKEQDLIAQRRMADATDDLVYLTKIEITLIIAGFAGVLATIIYTHLSYRLTAKTAKAQLRAYVLPTSVGFADGEADGLALAVNFKNSGQTPARKVSHILKFEITSAQHYTLSVSDNELRDGSDIGPGEHSSGNYLEPKTNSFTANSAEIEAGTKTAYAYGKLVYFDIFDRRHWVEFWFRYSHQQDMFVSCDDGFTST